MNAAVHSQQVIISPIKKEGRLHLDQFELPLVHLVTGPLNNTLAFVITAYVYSYSNSIFNSIYF